MSTLKNKDPQIIEDTMDLVSNLLSTYGWYALAVIFGLVVIWNKFLRKSIQQIRQQNEDPEIMESRAEQMERARRRQQELYDKQMEEFKQKESEKQNQKKKELLNLEKSVDKIKDNSDLRQRNSKPFRDNSFNPLMGSSSGSSSGFRRSRAGPSGGG